MRKWELLTRTLDARRRSPLYLQLSNAFADDIRKGRLKPGEALPGTRVLAEQLGVHRTTVMSAYQELVAEGLARTRTGGGTFVAERAKLAERPGAAPRRPSSPPTFTVPKALPVWPLQLPDPRGPLMMHGGLPDVRLLPAEPLARAFRRALRRHGRKLLSYGDPRGHEQLRRELATMLSHTGGLSVEPENLIITRGSQQALYLVAQALLSPDDLVAVEELGNPRVWAALRLAGAEIATVAVDEEGLDVDALAALVGRRRLRALYLTPHHQFPTNTVMSPARRERLAALALAHRFAIIEDDYDREFHYEGKPLAPLAAGAAGPNVIYIGTLSKVLAPGLRVGYIVAPASVLAPLVSLRAVCDMQGDALVECAVAELFEDGELVRHVRRMRETYHRRRDALAAALARHLGDALTFRVPDGGMAIWARVADGIDLDGWVQAGEALGVRFRGGGMFDYFARPLPYLRLGFTYHDEAELADAASRMARALSGPRRGPAPRPRPSAPGRRRRS
jgi:GntR family transcriptional regulator/MocR family aminotransferase